MKNLQKDVFDKVLFNLINFVSSQSKSDLMRNKNILPTCALVTGVNLPDHKDLFKILTKGIKKNASNHVARVKSAECGTLKILVKKIILQLHKVSM